MKNAATGNQRLAGPPSGAWAVHDRRRALVDTLFICTVALAAVGAGAFGLWISASSAIKDNFTHYLVGLAQAAVQQVDPVLHEAIRDPGQLNGPDYRRGGRRRP